MIDWPAILPLLLQIPIVGAFIVFTLKMQESFQNTQKERDQSWQAFLKEERQDYLAQEIRRDIEWQKFLGERSLQNRDILEGIIGQLREMSLNISSLNALLVSHDTTVREQLTRLSVELSMLKGVAQ